MRRCSRRPLTPSVTLPLLLPSSPTMARERLMPRLTPMLMLSTLPMSVFPLPTLVFPLPTPSLPSPPLTVAHAVAPLPVAHVVAHSVTETVKHACRETTDRGSWVKKTTESRLVGGPPTTSTATPTHLLIKGSEASQGPLWSLPPSRCGLPSVEASSHLLSSLLRQLLLQQSLLQSFAGVPAHP